MFRMSLSRKNLFLACFLLFAVANNGWAMEQEEKDSALQGHIEELYKLREITRILDVLTHEMRISGKEDITGFCGKHKYGLLFVMLELGSEPELSSEERELILHWKNIILQGEVSEHDFESFKELRMVLERLCERSKNELHYIGTAYYADGDVQQSIEQHKQARSIRAQALGDSLGQIAYFPNVCPNGWEYYGLLAGRVVVGSGAYNGAAQDGRQEAAQWNPGDLGGEMQHKLTVDEMPSHNHENVEYKFMLRCTGRGTQVKTDDTPNEPDIVEKGELLPAGNDQPHNNMPPYLVLVPCQKIVGD